MTCEDLQHRWLPNQELHDHRLPIVPGIEICMERHSASRDSICRLASRLWAMFIWFCHFVLRWTCLAGHPSDVTATISTNTLLQGRAAAASGWSCTATGSAVAAGHDTVNFHCSIGSVIMTEADDLERWLVTRLQRQVPPLKE